MILTDLISSISHALPTLVSHSAQSPEDEVFGHNIRYAFVQRSPSGMWERCDAVTANLPDTLGESTLGILGSTPTGHDVARVARERYGARVIHDRPLREVLDASTICVVLPWQEDLSEHVQHDKLAAVDAREVLVVWRHSHAIERALVHLGEHYDEPVGLAKLAEVASISKFQLVRLFTATLGITPHRFQLLLRLSRAKAMLREGTRITEIAHGVGFADHSHLGRSFKVLTGMTPSQYLQYAPR